MDGYLLLLRLSGLARIMILRLIFLLGYRGVLSYRSGEQTFPLLLLASSAQYLRKANTRLFASAVSSLPPSIHPIPLASATRLASGVHITTSIRVV